MPCIFADQWSLSTVAWRESLGCAGSESAPPEFPHSDTNPSGDSCAWNRNCAACKYDCATVPASTFASRDSYVAVPHALSSNSHVESDLGKCNLANGDGGSGGGVCRSYLSNSGGDGAAHAVEDSDLGGSGGGDSRHTARLSIPGKCARLKRLCGPFGDGGRIGIADDWPDPGEEVIVPCYS